MSEPVTYQVPDALMQSVVNYLLTRPGIETFGLLLALRELTLAQDAAPPEA